MTILQVAWLLARLPHHPADLFATLQRQFRLYITFLGIARPQHQFPHSCVCERLIYSQDRSIYFLQQKGRPILEIYNSLTDTWMWKLGLRPRYSFSGNICFKFSAFCLCSAGTTLREAFYEDWNVFRYRHWTLEQQLISQTTCLLLLSLHCKDPIPKIGNKYSQKGNCAASVPISTFMCLWAIYIFPWSVCLFCCRKICGPILGVYKSFTDTWMWKLGLRPRNSKKRNTQMRFSLQCMVAILRSIGIQKDSLMGHIWNCLSSCVMLKGFWLTGRTPPCLPACSSGSCHLCSTTGQTRVSGDLHNNGCQKKGGSSKKFLQILNITLLYVQ